MNAEKISNCYQKLCQLLNGYKLTEVELQVIIAKLQAQSMRNVVNNTLQTFDGRVSKLQSEVDEHIALESLKEVAFDESNVKELEKVNENVREEDRV